MLTHEAHMYAGFGKHLAEEWCGFNKVDGVAQVVEVKAVVPKFYGYYITEEASESGSCGQVGGNPYAQYVSRTGQPYSAPRRLWKACRPTNAYSRSKVFVLSPVYERAAFIPATTKKPMNSGLKCTRSSPVFIMRKFCNSRLASVTWSCSLVR